MERSRTNKGIIEKLWNGGVVCGQSCVNRKMKIMKMRSKG